LRREGDGTDRESPGEEWTQGASRETLTRGGRLKVGDKSEGSKDLRRNPGLWVESNDHAMVERLAWEGVAPATRLGTGDGMGKGLAERGNLLAAKSIGKEAVQVLRLKIVECVGSKGDGDSAGRSCKNEVQPRIENKKGKEQHPTYALNWGADSTRTVEEFRWDR
jgi:hypothetical protein